MESLFSILYIYILARTSHSKIIPITLELGQIAKTTQILLHTQQVQSELKGEDEDRTSVNKCETLALYGIR